MRTMRKEYNRTASAYWSSIAFLSPWSFVLFVCFRVWPSLLFVFVGVEMLSSWGEKEEEVCVRESERWTWASANLVIWAPGATGGCFSFLSSLSFSLPWTRLSWPFIIISARGSAIHCAIDDMNYKKRLFVKMWEGEEKNVDVYFAWHGRYPD